MSLWAIAGAVLIVVVLIAATHGNVSLGRREVEDFEVKLRAEPGVAAAEGAWGAAEREAYDDGSAEFEASVRGVKLPDGAAVEFVVDGVSLGKAAVERGRGRLEFDTRSGDDVPPVAAGQRIEVRHDGIVLLSGEFRHD